MTSPLNHDDVKYVAIPLPLRHWSVALHDGYASYNVVESWNVVISSDNADKSESLSNTQSIGVWFTCANGTTVTAI